MNNVHIFEHIGLQCKTQDNKIILLKTLPGYNNFQDSHDGSSVPYLVRNTKQNKYEVGVGQLNKDDNFYIVRDKIIASSNAGQEITLSGDENEFYIFANEYNFNTAFNNVIVKYEDFDVDNVRAVYIVDTTQGSIDAFLPPSKDNKSLIVDFKTINNPSAELLIKCSEGQIVHKLSGKNKHITLVCTGSEWIALQDHSQKVQSLSNPTFSAQSDPGGSVGELQYQADATTFDGAGVFLGNDQLLFGADVESSAHSIIPTSGESNFIFNQQYQNSDFEIYGDDVENNLIFDRTGGLGLNIPNGFDNVASGDFIVYGSGSGVQNLFFSYDGRLGINIPTGTRPQTVAHFVNTACQEGLRLENRSVCHPANLTLYHKPPLATIPENSVVATISLSSKNSINNKVDYAQLMTRILNYTQGQTKGEFSVVVNSGNAGVQTFKTNPAETLVNHGISKLSISNSSAGISAPEINFSGTSINFVDLSSGQSGVVNFGTINTSLITPNVIRLDTLATNSLLTVNADKEVVAASDTNKIAISNAPSGRFLSTGADGIVNTDLDLGDYFKTNNDVTYQAYPIRLADGCLNQILFDPSEVVSEDEYSIGDQISITDSSNNTTYNTVEDIVMANGIITMLYLTNTVSPNTVSGLNVQSISKGFLLRLQKYVDPEVTAINDSTYIVLSTRPNESTVFNGAYKPIGFTVYGDNPVPALDIRPGAGKATPTFAGTYYAYSTKSNSTPLQILVDSNGAGTNSSFNTANFNFASELRWSGLVTDVGTNGQASHYGTFDQNGNVAEWVADNSSEHTSNGARYAAGGSFQTTNTQALSAVESLDPATVTSGVGFRMASIYAKQDSDYISSQLSMDFVNVGNPHNDPTASLLSVYDSQTDTFTNVSLSDLGSVSNSYRIAKYEVTNAQYVEFLNCVASGNTGYALNLYDSRMEDNDAGGILMSRTLICPVRNYHYQYSTKPNYANKPVNFVSYLSALRFANWMHNGAPTELTTDVDVITESGAYSLGLQVGGYAIEKDPSAEYYLPDINQWYKAAYFEPGVAVNNSGNNILINTDTPDPDSILTVSGDATFYGGISASGALTTIGINVFGEENQQLISTSNDADINIQDASSGNNSLVLVNSEDGALQVGPNPSLTLSGTSNLDGSYFTGFSKAKTTIASEQIKILSDSPVRFSGISAQTIICQEFFIGDELGNPIDLYDGPTNSFLYKTGPSSATAFSGLSVLNDELYYTSPDLIGLSPLYVDSLFRVKTYDALNYQDTFAESKVLWIASSGLQVGPDNPALSGAVLVHQGLGELKYERKSYLEADGLVYNRFPKRQVLVDVFTKKVTFVTPDDDIPNTARELPSEDELALEYSFGDTVAIMHTGDNSVEYVKLAAQAKGPFDGPDYLYIGDEPLFNAGPGPEGASTLSSFYCPGVLGNEFDGGEEVTHFTGVMYSITKSSVLSNGLGYGLFANDEPAVSGFSCDTNLYEPLPNTPDAPFTFRPSSQNVISTRPTTHTMFNNVGENIDFVVYGRNKFQYNRYHPEIHDADPLNGGLPKGLIPSFKVDANVPNSVSGTVTGIFYDGYVDEQKTIPTGFHLDAYGKVTVNTSEPYVITSISKAIDVEPTGFASLDLVADFTVNGYTYSSGVITDHIYLSGIEPNTYIPGAVLTTDSTGRVVSVKPDLPPSIPGPPSLLSGIAGNASVDLSWVAPVENGGVPILDYDIEYSSTNGATWSVATDLVDPNTGAIITGLNNGTNYIFRVRAVNEVGSGQWSNPSAQITPSSNFPGPVRGLTLLRNSLPDEINPEVDSIAVTWAVPEDSGASSITKYFVRYKPFDGDSWITTSIDSTSLSSYSVDLTGLLPGPTYTIKVTAQNSYGEGVPVIENSIGDDGPPPEPPAPPNPNDFGIIEFSGSCTSDIT